MPNEITLPQLGDTVSAVTIERYYKQVGDSVEPGDPLVVVRSDRFEWDIPATSAGTIGDILAQPGATVAVGAVLVRLTGSVEDVPSTSGANNGRVARATPLARKIAAAHGVDLTLVAGSGHSGTIRRIDVLTIVGEGAAGVGAKSAFNSCFTLDLPTEATITAPQPSTASVQPAVASGDAAEPAATSRTHKVASQPLPLNALQQAIATQLLQSKMIIPHALTAVEVDVSRIMGYVDAHGARFAKRGAQLNVTTCVAHAAVATLTQQRLLNSVWSDEGIVVRGRIHLAVATSQGASGAVSVIPNAADLSLQGLARVLGSQQQSISDALPDSSALTFTICDEGASRWRHGIVAVSQGALLTIGGIERRPFVLEEPTGDTIVIRPLAILTLAYDARVATQPQADAFLTVLKDRLEHFNPL